MTVSSSELRDDVARLLSAEESLVRDPYPLYRRLREEAPVFVYDGGIVIVSSYQEARGVSRDHARFLAPERVLDRGAERLKLLSDADYERYHELVTIERSQLNMMNGEVHRRVRSAALRGFTPRRLAALRQSIEGLAQELLDQLADQREPDFMEFAYRLPLLVIMDMLGVPREDAELLRHWGDTIVAYAGEFPIRPETLGHSYSGLLEYQAYVRELIDRHRKGRKQVELVGLLLDASASDILHEDELVALYVLLLFAGHETTTNMFGNGLLALLSAHDQWRLLCSDPSLCSNAIEEMLRYDTPVQFFSKFAREEQTVATVRVQAGSTVMIAHGAANRDPRAFARADQFDILRHPNDHFSFGHGVHFCLGAAVARLEGRIGLEALVTRFPSMELAVEPESLEYNRHHVLRGVKSLPVDLGRECRRPPLLA